MKDRNDPRFFQLTIAYDGTDFAGWQVQLGQPTIQSELEKALAKTTNARVAVVGSGRTDSGVHAVAQVASCQLPNWSATAGALQRALNAKLPPSIVVTEARDAIQGFHAIRDSVGKRYRYQIRLAPLRTAFDYRYHWHLRGELDPLVMQRAASQLVGEHDFASFQAAGSDRKTTVRHIRDCDITVRDSTIDGQELSIEVEANGFLFNMVRNIVGTLVEIGRHKHPWQWIDEVLAACDRDQAGPTAPPQGLFLLRVDYPDHVLLNDQPPTTAAHPSIDNDSPAPPG